MFKSTCENPRIDPTLLRTICVLLLFQGYPVWALQPLQVHAEPHLLPQTEQAWAGTLDAVRLLAERWASALQATVSVSDTALVLGALTGGAGTVAVAGDVAASVKRRDASRPPAVAATPPLPPGPHGEEELSPPLAEHYRTVVRKEEATDETPMLPGWNLLSIPREPANMDPALSV